MGGFVVDGKAERVVGATAVLAQELDRSLVECLDLKKADKYREISFNVQGAQVLFETYDAPLLLRGVVDRARRRVVLQERGQDAPHRLSFGSLRVDDGRDSGDHGGVELSELTSHYGNYVDC